MSQLRIKTNEMFTLDVTVRESDEHTQDVFVKIERHYRPDSIHGCDEFMMTPAQLEQLGRFFIEQAEHIRIEQSFREMA